MSGKVRMPTETFFTSSFDSVTSHLVTTPVMPAMVVVSPTFLSVTLDWRIASNWYSVRWSKT